MILTNKHNLPKSVYDLLAKERYNGSSSTDYSVTTLLQPPRITQLKRRHYDELEEDAMDSVWSLFGQVAHSLLEEHGEENALNEERIHLTLLDRVISGQVDGYHDGVITDYKVTSAWTLVYGSRLHEWTEQLNLYAHLFRSKEYPVTELRICAILRDWDKNKAKREENYPKTPIVIIPLELWSPEHAEAFAIERLIEHKEAETKADWELPLCTATDMWEQAPKYAVMKEGAKRAVKVCDTREEAYRYIIDSCPQNWDKNGHSKDLYNTVVRVGKRTRCEDGYCPVSQFCNQYQEYLRENQL